MLKKFEVKNFKNFKEKITMNFSEVGGYQFNTECISHNTLGKMLVYGKNATGKTNLGRAITDIKNVLFFSAMSEESSFRMRILQRNMRSFVMIFKLVRMKCSTPIEKRASVF